MTVQDRPKGRHGTPSSLNPAAVAAAATGLTMHGATGYWPDQHWRTAQPEAQGIDSQALASVVDQVIQKQLAADASKS